MSAPKAVTIARAANRAAYMDLPRTWRKAEAIFKEHGGMLRTSKASALGVHPRTLYALHEAGRLQRVWRIPRARPTMDIDVLGRAAGPPEAMCFWTNLHRIFWPTRRKPQSRRSIKPW